MRKSNNNFLIYSLVGILLFIFSFLAFEFITEFIEFGELFIFTILTFTSILPLMIYIAYFDKKDSGSKFGLIGYKIIRFMRWIKNGNKD